MSLKMNGSTPQRSMSEINVTPLVDVMLVLLVVFIVTAPLLAQAVKVELPLTTKTDVPPDKHFATLSIDAQGNIFLNDTPQTLANLASPLQDLLQADTEIIVQFHADKNVPYGKVADTMAAAHKAGINKLAFITKEQ
ncbi:MAG: biopolymer transporter ExbD [Methylovulum sp.]|jgi:biopolymer transport protein ExbD|nr:biopolymer transporter ExbD [Methylovulum sp.]MCF7999197.1 biopolymer transporter ExbD [Methylovulum sp.]